MSYTQAPDVYTADKNRNPAGGLRKVNRIGFRFNARFELSEYLYSKEYLNEFGYDNIVYTCLNLAIKNSHFSAARCLLQNGADCEISTKLWDRDSEDSGDELEDHIRTPLAELAMNANAPLDLFDLLATPRTLTNNGNTIYLPLHRALAGGHIEGAQRLIKLGAGVNLKDYNDKLPAELYECNTKEYHDELFLQLIPRDPTDVFQCVDRLVRIGVDTDHKNTIQSKIIHRLFQYLQAADPLRVSVDFEPGLTDIQSAEMVVNNKLSIKNGYGQVFWWSVILMNLGCTFESTPQDLVPSLHRSASELNVQFAHKLDDIWNTHRETVKSLENLCIQPIRRCMRDFSDDSFSDDSLPVPKIVRGLLMNQRVAEIACRAVKCINAVISLKEKAKSVRSEQLLALLLADDDHNNNEADDNDDDNDHNDDIHDNDHNDDNNDDNDDDNDDDDHANDVNDDDDDQANDNDNDDVNGNANDDAYNANDDAGNRDDHADHADNENHDDIVRESVNE